MDVCRLYVYCLICTSLILIGTCIHPRPRFNYECNNVTNDLRKETPTLFHCGADIVRKRKYGWYEAHYYY